MLVVGSIALKYWLNDIGRTIHDYDIWMSNEEFNRFCNDYYKFEIKEAKYSYLFEIDKKIYEIKPYYKMEETDKLIFDNSTNKTFQVDIPYIGMCFVACPQTVYDMKKATLHGGITEPKHSYDFNLLEANAHKYFFKRNSDIFKLRLEETKKRVASEKKVKYDFFHKYHIPEYVVHDDLHVMIADLIDLKIPTYQKITTAETDISEELFNNLSHHEKLSLMVEESLVLALERWFIPQMIENGINHKLIDMFYNNNEGLPTYRILQHCCITGLKGEAEYITKFSRENFFEIEKLWIQYKSTIANKKGFPSWFFNQLFELRDKYKKGEKVALI